MESRTAAELRVSGGGLHSEAGWCESAAGALASNSAPSATGLSSPLGNAAAVTRAHAEVVAAGIRCTLRMQATATELASAATGYSANEARSAAQLRALSPTTVT
ncbi:hypothetical protein [Mycobacterium spongiae]|uniref:Uncharacterized protein n=1 Tax=Mycobacterium spongiae TaxID=886343 RepID=A0A975JUM4_9MYCO|nr:hypothetical protein [Mycobacterium spongiae]QUR66007.1 hypothetical protein F6B93_01970 [Mycobacterium spongiae]